MENKEKQLLCEIKALVCECYQMVFPTITRFGNFENKTELYNEIIRRIDKLKGKKTLFDGLIGIWVRGSTIVCDSFIEEIDEAQEKLEKSKSYPLTKIKSQTLWNHHDGRHRGDWNIMVFEFDHKEMTTKMYMDGYLKAMWSRVLNESETCSLSINYCQLFSKN